MHAILSPNIITYLYKKWNSSLAFFLNFFSLFYVNFSNKGKISTKRAPPSKKMRKNNPFCLTYNGKISYNRGNNQV